MSVKLIDNSIAVKAALDDACIAYLYEAAGEVETQVKRNSRVGSGQLKNSWAYSVDEGNGEATIGSPLQNAIWEEFGTGEYALKGDGRKGGWTYQDDKGKWHHTFGKTPNRALHKAFTSLKSALINRAKQVIGGKMK